LSHCAAAERHRHLAGAMGLTIFVKLMLAAVWATHQTSNQRVHMLPSFLLAKQTRWTPHIH
jgi:hypothetical protein